MRPSPRILISSRHGISLLEVVLALAILGIASAYLSQAMQLAAQNAIRAQRLTQAELVAESVMNQVIGGVIPAQPMSWTPYSSTATGSSSSGTWNYSLAIVATEVPGMIGIQVGVQEVVPGVVVGAQPADLMVTRWIIDPQLQLDVPPEEEASEDSQSTSQGGQSQGAGQAGGGQAAGQGQGAMGVGQGGMGQGGFGGGFGAGGGQVGGGFGGGRGGNRGGGQGGGGPGGGGFGGGGFGGPGGGMGRGPGGGRVAVLLVLAAGRVVDKDAEVSDQAAVEVRVDLDREGLVLDRVKEGAAAVDETSRIYLNRTHLGIVADRCCNSAHR